MIGALHVCWIILEKAVETNGGRRLLMYLSWYMDEHRHCLLNHIWLNEDSVVIE